MRFIRFSPTLFRVWVIDLAACADTAGACGGAVAHQVFGTVWRINQHKVLAVVVVVIRVLCMPGID